jgi:hypothetical protein
MKEINMERWKLIDGTNGKIMVSDEGRIKSLLRDERILKMHPNPKGYMVVRVTINRKKISLKVHREVAKAFNDNPNKLPQVNHKDGDKTNNNYWNLEWVTNKENADHAKRTGLWNSVIQGSLRENERRKKKIIGTNPNNEIVHFDSVSDAERYIGSRHVTDVLKGKRNHAMGWTFEYVRG